MRPAGEPALQSVTHTLLLYHSLSPFKVRQLHRGWSLVKEPLVLHEQTQDFTFWETYGFCEMLHKFYISWYLFFSNPYFYYGTFYSNSKLGNWSGCYKSLCISIQRIEYLAFRIVYLALSDYVYLCFILSRQ